MRLKIGLLRLLIALGLTLGAISSSGCAGVHAPNMYGPGKLHDITEIRRNMSPNEVLGIMGKDYKTMDQEGLNGLDMGISVWEYPEGKIYFNTDGVFKVEPYRR